MFFKVIIFVLTIDLAVSQLIPFGTEQIYEFKNELESGDVGKSQTSGYRIVGQLMVGSVYNSDDTQILRIQLNDPKLNVRRGSDYNVLHSTNLDGISSSEFYLLLKNNIEAKIFCKTESESTALQNIRRGIASLFLFQFNESFKREEDVSGSCSVIYQKFSSTSYRKIKSECANWALKIQRRTERPLDVSVKSYQEIDYKLSQDGVLFKILSKEDHKFFVELNNRLGSFVSSLITLQHSSSSELSSDSLITPKELLSNWKSISLEGDVDGNLDNQDQKTLEEAMKQYQSDLSKNSIGSERYALVFANLLPTIRNTPFADLEKILKSTEEPKHRDLLIDLFGAAQTKDSHDAVMSVFNFDKNDDIQHLERYMQAIAISTRPNEDIMDYILLKLNDKTLENEKLKHSAYLTLSAMAHKYSKLHPKGINVPIYNKIKKALLSELSACTTSDCKIIFIQSLQNLKDPSTINQLMELAVKDSKSVSVATLKALRTFPVELFTESNRKSFEKIFFQIQKKFDSSARTIALDILLELKPNRSQIIDIMEYLMSCDKAFEVKTYVLQKIKMLGDQCPKFLEMINSILRSRNDLRNYNVLAQNGLTTALQREYSSTPSFNGTLVSIQEVEKGVLKRGVVDMMVGVDGEQFNLFTLGLYTNGLSSFMGGSNDEEEKIDEDDTATAGMELSVLGVQMRPLVFFTGQGELMGHVWSGTASEPTPAYQATFLMHDHEEFIILQDGTTIYFNLVSANSIDLSGQIEFSIWNRNAHTEINKNSGLAFVGLTRVGTKSLQLQHGFVAVTEPNIALIADIDFYSEVKLCMQLIRLETIFKVNLSKFHITPNAKRTNKSETKLTYKVPGRTMALNQKNNEMCNIIME